MLLLRQACQPLLNELGLSDLHVTIQDKTLTIVGSCGKPLVAISGIQFSKNSASNAERDFAVSLFQQFLVTYGKELKDFVSAKQEFLSLPEPELPTGAKNYYLSSAQNDSYVEFEPFEKTSSSSACIKIYIDGRVSFSYYNPTINAIASNAGILKSLETVTKQTIAAFSDYKIKKAAIDAIGAKIAKCDI